MEDTSWIKLRTYNGLPFKYQQIQNGDRQIEYGSLPFRETITKDVFQEVLQNFKGKSVLLGATYGSPPPESLGEWLVERFPGRNLAMYIGSILVREGYAEWGESDSEEGVNLHFLD